MTRYKNQPLIPKPTCQLVSPTLALTWLRLNHPQNRQIDAGNVKVLTAAMVDGTFRNDTATVKFSPSGELIDGQHRLWAIVNASCDVELYVLRNVDLTQSIDWWAIRAIEK